MDDKTVVLITGVADYWGRRLAERLLTDENYQVIGLDDAPPEDEIAGLDFVEATLGNPALPDLLSAEAVAVVCHLKFVEQARRSRTISQLNVQGASALLAACAEAGVGRVVFKSSSSIYGALPDNSTFLSEEAPLRGSREVGYIHDYLELEAICQEFERQETVTELTRLRFAHIIGPTADTPMTRFLKQQSTPILLGFDPLLQFIHEDDVIEALVQAISAEVVGLFNVAAEPAMPLTRVLSLARKVPVPVIHSLANLGLNALRRTTANVERIAPLSLDELRYSCIVDLARVQDELGFMAEHMADEALRHFAQRYQKADEAEALAQEEQQLREIIEHRRQAKEEMVEQVERESYE